MKNYEFTFENGSKYYGTCAEKNEFCKGLSKSEKAEMGKIVGKTEVSAEFVENFRWNAMLALGLC